MFVQLLDLMTLQQFPLSGNPGDNGPSVRHPVGMGPESGVVVAVNQLLAAMISVPGVQQRWETVYQLSVQVSQVSIIPLHGRRHFPFLNLNP